MNRFSERLCRWVCGSIAAFALIGAAHASPTNGLIILEGSDSQTVHGLNPYSNNFQAGLQTYSSAPTLGVLAVGPGSAPIGSAPAGETVVSSLADLAGMGKTLMDYSGIYFMSPFGCCSESSAMTGFEVSILAFHNGGRSIAIEDYTGGAGWDFLLGTTGGANSHVAGFDGGAPGLSSCFDGNFLTPAGAAFGLGAAAGALPNIGCFGHQAYEASFFDPLGFTAHLADNPGLNGFNVVISNGGGGLQEATTVPEPGTLPLLALALIGFAAARRKSA